MCALAIPQGVIEQIGRRRRSFLWSRAGMSKGAKNLVAWNQSVIQRTPEGYRIPACYWRWYNSSNASSCVASLSGDLHGQYQDMLRSLLPIYLPCNHDCMGWWWLHGRAFPEAILSLHKARVKVKQASEGELGRSLVARRSIMATTQLNQVLEIVELHALNRGRDRRQSLVLKRMHSCIHVQARGCGRTHKKSEK
jgi:hypothetical protein